MNENTRKTDWCIRSVSKNPHQQFQYGSNDWLRTINTDQQIWKQANFKGFLLCDVRISRVIKYIYFCVCNSYGRRNVGLYVTWLKAITAISETLCRQFRLKTFSKAEYYFVVGDSVSVFWLFHTPEQTTAIVVLPSMDLVCGTVFLMNWDHLTSLWLRSETNWKRYYLTCNCCF